jgi:hypothetical protein
MYCSTDLKINHKNFTAHKIHNILFWQHRFLLYKNFRSGGMKLIDIQEFNELYTNFGKLEILCTYLYILNLEQ